MKTALESSNVEVLKYNANGESHEKVDKQAVIEKIDRQANMVSLAESIKTYTWEEKYEWAHQRKLKGNRLFSKKNYDGAIQLYQEALVGLDLKSTAEKNQRMINELQIPCVLNIASCMKAKKEYIKAVELCNKAIELNKSNPTSFLRRGFIYQAMKEGEKALADFKTAKDLGVDEASLDAINRAREEIKSAKEKRKKAYKEFFEEGSLYQSVNGDESNEKITVQESKSSLDDEGPKILYYNDDLEELNKFGVLKYVAYPLKMSYKFMREKTGCCRRRRINYDVVESESRT